MLKFSKYNLLAVATTVLLFSACSSKEPSLGDKMMEAGTALESDAKLKKELSKQWIAGSELIKEGKKKLKREKIL
jgi:hypothetical protein